jgi:hypothetical protein
MMLTALRAKTAAVNHGSAEITVSDSVASAMPPASAPRVKPTLSAEYM